MHIAHDPDNLHLRVSVAASPSVAWLLLTSLKGIAKWWGPQVSLDHTPGGSVRATWQEGDRTVNASGSVLGHQPEQKLEFSWSEPEWEASTTVHWWCEPAGDGVELHVAQRGWLALPEPIRETRRQAHAEQWETALRRLVELQALTRAYPAEGLAVAWREGRCQHAGACVRALGAVFNPKRKPWIDTSAASSEEISAAVAKCPSGALEILEQPR